MGSGAGSPDEGSLMIASHDTDAAEHVKAPPEAIWASGFAVVSGKRRRRDRLTWVTIFRRSCGCLSHEGDIDGINEIMRRGPIAEFVIFTVDDMPDAVPGIDEEEPE